MKITVYKIDGTTVFGITGQEISPEQAKFILSSMSKSLKSKTSKYALITAEIDFHESYLLEQKIREEILKELGENAG
jgi:hypothetical protein